MAEKRKQTRKKMSKETRRKIGAKTRARLKKGHPMLGKKHTPESIQRMRDAHKRNAPKTRARMINQIKTGNIRKKTTTTSLERIVYIILKRAGISATPQYRVDDISANKSGIHYADLFIEPDRIIEAYGDYHHANPHPHATKRQYTAKDLIQYGKRGEYAQARVRWKLDAQINREMEAQGFKVLIVWQGQIRSDLEGVRDMICDFVGVPVNKRSDLGGLQKEAKAVESEMRHIVYEKNKNRSLAEGRKKYNSDPVFRQEKLARAKKSREKHGAKWNATKRAKYPEIRDEFNKNRRERRANDPEWRDKTNARRRIPENRARDNQTRRERYANDPEYRKRVNDMNKKKHERRKEEINKKRRERYANDPEYRKKTIEGNKKKYEKSKDEMNRRNRERYANDPEYRKRINDSKKKVTASP